MNTDEMLVASTLKGDLTAFEELIDRYKNSVFSIVYRIIGHYQESEDIAQEIFITVYQKLYQFDQTKKFSPWLHRIAVNTCINSLRKKKKIVTLNFDETYTQQYDTHTTNTFGDPQQFLERKELSKEINNAIMNLNENYRLVLILRYQLEMTNQEIAEALEISKENVEVKIHRARKALRKELTKRWEERGVC
ncbi:RNA polymerase sigma factor SigW [Candidatus Syntrophocurvum alkaliphilum]|uniref:RNA polymerase sigma factor SigW n=1 Tax=Candidatus Syntrophocurvum alkaliphilum TaxID=2293317 RepID=A0A6I6DGT1_9FIRM|nr:sigma-70 family RNA polymerase sigma factor [Candidatus Syntrophocurvum alkaliphilum]QGT99590.1 RNA polymerase sigma factor SigW [Candidatus Syntrophocurvum alkaliphilum]